MNRPQNLNIIMELERLKGEKINSISKYNSANQRQIIQGQQRMLFLKYKNDNQYKQQITYTGIKNYNCNC